ncbi:MAG: hypothetical protein ISS79_05580 [Phycisphaerae bacterium]|nr:hypothetical protein [Phycisphaerae bacterium]
MAKRDKQNDLQHLSPSAAVFIGRVVTKMRYRRKVGQDVQAELVAHFEDGLKDCATDEDREQTALRLIADFGDIKLLALLLRRAKKRCRPLWRTAITRTLQTFGVLIIGFVLYTIWFSTGKPVISVDYTALLNKMNRPELRDEDNAWPSYKNAASLFIEPNDPDFKKLAFSAGNSGERRKFTDLADNEKQRIAEWVELNQSAWNEFAAGSAKSYCYREYTHDPNDQERWLLSILLPNLGDIRNLARVGIWRSQIAAEQGRIHQALGDSIAVARAGSHWQGKGTLIEQLVGTAMTRMACNQIASILEAHDPPGALLEQTYRQFSDIYPDGFTLMNMEGERLTFMDTVQRVFTKGGFGGGHLIPGAWTYIADEQIYSLEGQDKMLFMPLYAAESMIHARRDKTIAKANEFYSRQEKYVKMTPHQKRAANIETAHNMISSLSRYRFFLLHMLVPALDRVFEFGFRGKASYQATLTILALQRFQAEKGQYPGSLSQLLAAGFLDELPMDPYSDKPLVYKKSNEDFTLYSLGPNFEDDAGQPGKTEKGRLKDWQDNGDTVFWPVPKT